MTPLLQAETYPLEYDSRGTLRIEGTRIPIDTIVYSFQEGQSAEEICEHFPVLELGSVYAAITYYLRHRDEVDAYLRRRESEAVAIRMRIEARSSSTGLRQKLLARLSA